MLGGSGAVDCFRFQRLVRLPQFRGLHHRQHKALFVAQHQRFALLDAFGICLGQRQRDRYRPQGAVGQPARCQHLLVIGPAEKALQW